MRRINILLGRIGTIILMVSIALIIVSLIPPIENGTREYKGEIKSNSYSILYMVYAANPQTSLRGEILSDGKVTVYILNVGANLRELGGIGDLTHQNDVSVLEDFLKNHAEALLFKGETVDGRLDFEYIPGGIVNATVVVANYNSAKVNVDSSIKRFSVIAPGNRILPYVELMIPVGVILTAQWSALVWKEKRSSKSFKS